jgi:hypothetical protein
VNTVLQDEIVLQEENESGTVQVDKNVYSNKYNENHCNQGNQLSDNQAETVYHMDSSSFHDVGKHKGNTSDFQIVFAIQEEKTSGTVQMDKVICLSKYNVISSNQDNQPSDNQKETVHHMDSSYGGTGNQLEDKCLLKYKGISSDILEEDASNEEKMCGTLQMDKDLCSNNYNVTNSNQDSHFSGNQEETVCHRDRSSTADSGQNVDDDHLLKCKGNISGGYINCSRNSASHLELKVDQCLSRGKKPKVKNGDFLWM